ncbi:4-hydroxy-tetrahydrodipicolinate reductase [Pedobacter flavus]|uniref:4-hydroxy-tetrahydrodipicolinate reductase n=1 Tax=Pedobacter flavus TaxID=3113906 RepID=A0ABU7H1B1_9SPHI|nr:4-hydroxy-tetrahydrodipicolinate reductase [Pedobacter sp. VNH31]MEE1885003.1 4-hydroxy-tetrahydrodipicolinate reductase [Pedobacter sp. VNH31]
MKIALLGYGKMGQMIEKFATQRGHSIVLKIGAGEVFELDETMLKDADMAIDFSAPDAVLKHIDVCLNANVPVVVGTTGWYSQLQEVKDKVMASNNSLLYGSNFSVGVNLFFAANKYLAKLMNNYPVYDVQIEEIHHTQKLDSPSGTAITIAEGIIEEIERKNEWVNHLEDEIPQNVVKPNELLIQSLRIDEVPGTHTVIYSSEVDEITFQHTAHNRAGFALGAVVAAEWLENKQGFYSVEDVFNFK